METILINEGAGFIGSNLATLLKKKYPKKDYKTYQLYRQNEIISSYPGI